MTTPGSTRWLALCTLAAAAMPAALVSQTTVNLTPSRDNTLYQDPAGIISNGSGPSLFCGKTAAGSIRRALLHFDVAGVLPAGARVLSATLTLEVAQSVAFLPTPAGAHRVLQDWGEGASIATGGGGGGGTLAAPNDATWLHTFYPTSFWASPGGDFAAVASFTFPLPGLGPVTTAPEPGLIADVQGWLDNPAQNFGWLLKLGEITSSTARRINSREATSARPTLSITYLPAGQTGTWGVGCPVGAGNFGAAWSGSPVGGTTIQIVLANAPPSSVGVHFLSLGLDPVGFPLVPGCSVHLPLALPIVGGSTVLTDPAGAGASPFQVPSGFPGVLIAVQSVVLDGSPIGFTHSNAALALLQ